MRGMYLVSGLAFAALVAAGIQITPLVSLNSNVPVIPYCTVPGYPASPTTGVSVWYKADTYSPCSATTESTWTDSSGNSNTATFTAGTFTCNSNVLNGHNALSISGSPSATMATSLAGTTIQTAFVVYLITSYSANANYSFFSGSSPSGKFQYRISANGAGTSALQQVLAEGASLQSLGTIAVTVNTWHQGTFNASPGGSNTSFLHLDLASDELNSLTQLIIPGPNMLWTNGHNGGEFMNGKIAEMLYYSGTGLSNANTVATECYLYGKYGI